MASIEFLALGVKNLWVELTFYEIVLFSQKLKYFELIWMKLSWNTLTLVLHWYAILSLVELNFCLKNPWVSTGNCTGNSVGAARGLAAARMLFLLAGVHWNAAGRLPGHVECVEWSFLRVELADFGCTLSLNECLEVGSGESAGCLKNLCRIGLNSACVSLSPSLLKN